MHVLIFTYYMHKYEDMLAIEIKRRGEERDREKRKERETEDSVGSKRNEYQQNFV